MEDTKLLSPLFLQRLTLALLLSVLLLTYLQVRAEPGEKPFTFYSDYSDTPDFLICSQSIEAIDLSPSN